jgi:5'-nucleotidase
VFNSIENAGLDIQRGAFRNGRDVLPFLRPFRCSLFLSAEPDDVARALGEGFASALVLAPPTSAPPDDPSEVRIAFDGDAVLFGSESEEIYKSEGLKAFLENERVRAHEPMSPGPLRPFLDGLARVQQYFDDGHPPIRTALVTARNAPAHKRVVYTLRAWNVRIDETFFLGGMEKTEVIDAFAPHIYFDDQLIHLDEARARTPSAHVVPRTKATADEGLFSEEQLPPAAKSRPRDRRRKSKGALVRPDSGKSSPPDTSVTKANIIGTLSKKHDTEPDVTPEDSDIGEVLETVEKQT